MMFDQTSYISEGVIKQLQQAALQELLMLSIILPDAAETDTKLGLHTPTLLLQPRAVRGVKSERSKVKGWTGTS